MELLEHAVLKWLPSKNDLNKIVKFGKDFSDSIWNSSEMFTDNIDEVDDELDEDSIQEIQANRMLGGLAGEITGRQKSQICFFDTIKSTVKYRISDFPKGIKEDIFLTKCEKLWSLDEKQRIRFLYSMLIKATQEEHIKELSQHFNVIRQLQNEKEELEVKRKFRYELSSEKIVIYYFLV